MKYHPEVAFGYPSWKTEVDLIAKPITAWRAWNQFKDGSLRSLVMFYEWSLDNVNTADCCIRNHIEVPDAACYCGFWGFKSEKILKHFFETDKSSYTWNVIGTIEMWGYIVEGTTGYRSQYARVIEVNGI